MKNLLVSLMLLTPFLLSAQGKMNGTQVPLAKVETVEFQPDAALYLYAATSPIGNLETAVSDDVSSDCRCKGKVLKGKVKVVNAFPDFKVQVVDAFPDLKVKTVSAFPDDCGEWQFVDAFPDFTIQFVDAFPDFKIKFVDAFPGMK